MAEMTLEQVRSNMRDAMNSVLKDDTRRMVVDWYNAIDAAIKQRGQDAKDAARYRWLRDAPQELVEVYFATDKNPTGWGDWNSWKDKDAGIDTHMAKESGR